MFACEIDRRGDEEERKRMFEDGSVKKSARAVARPEGRTAASLCQKSLERA